MKTRHRMRRDLWATGAAGAYLAAATALAPTAALAQTAAAAPAEGAQTYAIPAGPMSTALNRFADQSGLALVYTASLTAGLHTDGFNGKFTVREALARLLSGTGLSFRFLDAKTITLEPPPISGARTLGVVQVEGVQTDAFAPLNGFGAGAGNNGGSDPTATEGTGSLTTNGATVASKTPQSLKETPQSVTVITAERIQQQNLTDLTSALNAVPGVTLVVGNSLQTTFYSRGFQITAFQIDGGGPLDLGSNSNYATTPNLAEYDNIQVLRGSDALFGGAGQPGGVVSLDRKRPLDHEQLLVDVDTGSWNNHQIQADVTGPIGFDGHLRARLVVNDQDRDYFYDLAHQNKAFVYGVIEGDLGPNTLIRAGFSYEQQQNTGFNPNGLPRYSDGGDLDLPRSTNLSASWNQWNLSTPELFAALEHQFNSNWGLKFNLTRLAQDSTEQYNYNYGLIYRDDPASSSFGEIQSQPATYHNAQYTADATLNGAFQLFGLKQTLAIGADYSLTSSANFVYSAPTFVPIDVFSFDPASLNPEPPNPLPYFALPVLRQEQWGGYVTLNLQPIQNLHLIGGARLSSYWLDILQDEYFGSLTPFEYETKQNATAVLTPHFAATYGLTPDITVYASYADIFQPQGEDLYPSGKPLPPVTGATYETGIKGAFGGGKLNASLSIYYTDESNEGTPYYGACLVGGSGSCYLDNGVVISQGVDLELSGELLPGWQVQGGYTYNTNRYKGALQTGPDDGFGLGSTYQSQQPVHQVKLWTSYRPAGRFDRWTVGGGLRLESARYTAGSVCSVQLDPTTGNCPSNVYVPFAFTQGLYAVVDLRAAYRFGGHWQAALDITNIGDTRYYATAGQNTGGNFYGEPRAFMLSLRAAY